MMKSKNAPLVQLISPFVTLAARAPSSPTYGRIESVIFEPLLASLTSGADGKPGSKRPRITAASPPSYPNIALKCSPPNSGSSRGGGATPSQPTTPEDLRQAVLKKIFEVASQEETRDSNRRKLYAIWKARIEDEHINSEWDGS